MSVSNTVVSVAAVHAVLLEALNNTSKTIRKSRSRSTALHVPVPHNI